MKKFNSSVTSLFSIPLYETKLNREFTEKEMNFVRAQKNSIELNSGNSSSKDNYILETQELNEIKRFVEICCQDYLDKVLCPSNGVQLYITQSWVNFTHKNQYHHKHEHPNSLISGVLYFDVDKDKDRIHFFDARYKFISLEVQKDKFNLWNSPSWWIPVFIGKLVMFPSSLPHSVEKITGENTRISLSFNTFIKGTFGNKKNLTELVL
jgi:uncharacterized protein (TIGR02466 family)|tara:strand:- start:291 stop:917 length:627 start_codon:yes stop_codon:yes gene_type:complete